MPETFLDRYEILELLGKGGIGSVYRARDNERDTDVAIKILNGRFADAAAHARFPEEARVLASLRHKNIAAFMEFASDGETNFLVMEYVRGRTLTEVLAEGPMSQMNAVQVATQIASALGEAHRLGIFHSDLKPSNVILADDSNVKLVDFGHAQVIERARRLSSKGKTSGLATLPYLAPETILEGIIDRQTDVYGLGMLLYEMSTARRPYPEDTPFELAAAIVHLPPEFPSVVARKLTAPFRTVALKALSKDPRNRYPDMEVFGAVLRKVQ